MTTLFVVNRASDWPQEATAAAVATAKAYLTGGTFQHGQYEHVINLCGCERLQGPGFYVSLLAEARGHQPLPAARTLEDLRGTPATAPALKEVEQRVQDSLPPPAAGEVEVSAYFGCDPHGRHDAVSRTLFTVLQAPLLRAGFRYRSGRWRLSRIQALSAAEIPEEERAALLRAAERFIAGGRAPSPASGERPSIAILHTPGEAPAPSNPAALRHFLRAAEAIGMRAEVIDRGAIARLSQFDALFIRDTTSVNHYTYQFSQRAAAQSLVVIDDPDSILRCTNKVYLNELLTRHGIAVPRTLMVHRDNLAQVAPALGLPCIVKQPDGDFSLGVRKASTEKELREHAAPLLERSELIVAQEFLPTAFDWRVTVLEGRALFVCKYFMAPGHWQVHKYEPGRHLEGAHAALTVGESPLSVVDTALRAARLIGTGLYGVDLKVVGDQCYVIEINDNPNIDAGVEDEVLKDALYRDIMGVFLRRIGERRAAHAS